MLQLNARPVRTCSRSRIPVGARVASRRRSPGGLALGLALVIAAGHAATPALAELPLIGKCVDRAKVIRERRARGEQIGVSSERKGFALHIAERSNVKSVNVTEPLLRRVMPEARFVPSLLPFNDLVYYYETNLANLRRLYPENTFDIDPRRALQQYKNALKMEMDDVHRLPFLPITPIIDEPFDIEMYQLETEYQGKKVHGLRSRQILHRPAGQRCPDTMFFVYMPDVNARVLGFTHGRFVPEVSENVDTSDVFFYNGIRRWEAHSHQKMEDQATKAIPLTNFAHAGRTYVISGHPDFALITRDPSEQRTVITFYLWKAAPSSAEGPPDFFYEAEIYFDQPAEADRTGR